MRKRRTSDEQLTGLIANSPLVTQNKVRRFNPSCARMKTTAKVASVSKPSKSWISSAKMIAVTVCAVKIKLSGAGEFCASGLKIVIAAYPKVAGRRITPKKKVVWRRRIQHRIRDKIPKQFDRKNMKRNISNKKKRKQRRKRKAESDEEKIGQWLGREGTKTKTEGWDNGWIDE